MTYRNLPQMTENEYIANYNTNQNDADDCMDSLDAILNHDATPVYHVGDYEDNNGEFPVDGIVIEDMGKLIWIIDYDS
jgi:hypothetical protein